MNPIIRKALETKLDRFGIDWLKVESLDIRPADKAVFAVVSLDGESDPVELTVLYKLDGDDFVIDEVEASRVWMSKALGLALSAKGNRFPLPSGLPGMAVRRLL